MAAWPGVAGELGSLGGELARRDGARVPLSCPPEVRYVVEGLFQRDRDMEGAYEAGPVVAPVGSLRSLDVA